MVLRMFSIYDTKSKVYIPPMFYHNEGHAMRSILDRALQDQNGMLAKFPGDFKIFEVGEYDDSTCEINGHVNPTYICTVEDLISNHNSGLGVSDEND